MEPNWRISNYLISLPERVLRSATGLAAGLVRELSGVAVPDFLRRTHLYRALVENTLRFLIEQVGQVPDVYPSGDTLARNFLIRRTAGNGLELIGLLTFHASPVWVMAALADLSGAGRQLIQEIASTLQHEGLLDPQTSFATVDQMLDGLEQSAGRAANAVNMPPLDVAELRREWNSIREELGKVPSPKLPSIDDLRARWAELESEAAAQQRSVYELSTLMAMSTVREMPGHLLWFGHSAVVAASTAGRMIGEAILVHYGDTLKAIHRVGYLRYFSQEFRPYLKAAAMQFSPEHRSLTERFLFRSE